jgi:hypothetical protein
MAAPTKQELLGGAPTANWGIQYDEYGRPITSDARAGDAQMDTFTIDPATGQMVFGQQAQVWTPGQVAGGGANASNARATAPTTGAQGSRTPGSQVGTDAAYQALNMLSPIAQQGFTAADMQGINAAGNAAALQSQAMIQSLAQQAAMRGQAGGGIGQVQQASAAQQGANQGMQRGTGIAMAANDRRMNAIGDMAQLGMGIDSSAFQHQLADTDLSKYLSSAAGQAAQGAYQGRLSDQENERRKRSEIAGYITGGAQTIAGLGGGS